MTTYYPATPKTHNQLSGFDRVKVDPGQTNFWLGRQFRTFQELNIPAADSLVIKIVTTGPVLLTSADLAVDGGWCRVATMVGGTEGGTFTAGPPVFPLNNLPVGKDKLEAFTSAVTLFSGGTHTGGTTLDVIRIKTADNSNFLSSVKGSDDLARGVSPGTYYYQFTNLGTDAVTGVFRLSWEDRPQT